MKKDTHPADYRTVLFEDIASGERFLIGSTIRTTEKGTYEGKEYDKYVVEISSASHPVLHGRGPYAR
jgi:large subunit ribosomal protein L31